MFEDLAIPIVVAPMAGGVSTPELVAGAVRAGATGFLAAGYLTPDALAAQVEATRALADGPFGVNLFVPGGHPPVDLADYRDRVAAEGDRLGVAPGTPEWDDDHYAAKLDIVATARVPVVSFTFGLPRPEDVARLHDHGAKVVVTVTTPQEARLAAEAGADALCVQGGAAGGHRGTFADDTAFPGGAPLYDLLPALRLIGGATALPLIAAGGLGHGADVAAVLAAGAVAAQLGTAFLRCPEAGTAATYRAALADPSRGTTLTRAFSGRPARGLVNRFIVEHGPAAPSAYPEVNHLTRPVRSAGARTGDPEVMSLWAGQAYPLAGEASVADVLTTLSAQAADAANALRARLGLS